MSDSRIRVQLQRAAIAFVSPYPVAIVAAEARGRRQCGIGLGFQGCRVGLQITDVAASFFSYVMALSADRWPFSARRNSDREAMAA